MTTRRAFMAGSLALVVTPLVARAQQDRRPFRVAIVGVGPDTPDVQYFVDGLYQGLRDLGYVRGRDVAIEYRWPLTSTSPEYDPLLHLPDELFALKPDVAVAWGEFATDVVRRVHRTPPGVFVLYAEPREPRALFASVERPGGKWTGVLMSRPELIEEQIRIVKEAVPRAARLAVVWDSSDPGGARAFNTAHVAARSVGMETVSVEARTWPALEAALTAADADAVFVVASPVALLHGRLLVERLTERGLPAIYPFTELAERGGLIAYGTSLRFAFRRAATYVDRILKGAKPADIPVEQVMRFELVINLRTARALGMTIPPALRNRAARVFE